MPSMLEQGIALAEANRKNEALKFFGQAIIQNPNEISAWMWISQLVEDKPTQRYCYINVLAIESDHILATQFLDFLDNTSLDAKNIISGLEKFLTSKNVQTPILLKRNHENSASKAPAPQPVPQQATPKKYNVIDILENAPTPSPTSPNTPPYLKNNEASSQTRTSISPIANIPRPNQTQVTQTQSRSAPIKLSKKKEKTSWWTKALRVLIAICLVGTFIFLLSTVIPSQELSDALAGLSLLLMMFALIAFLIHYIISGYIGAFKMISQGYGTQFLVCAILAGGLPILLPAVLGWAMLWWANKLEAKNTIKYQQCPICGHKIPVGVVYCPHCGQEFQR